MQGIAIAETPASTEAVDLADNNWDTCQTSLLVLYLGDTHPENN